MWSAALLVLWMPALVDVGAAETEEPAAPNENRTALAARDRLGRARPAGDRAATGTLYAGLRASRIPFSPFPAPAFFEAVSGCMTTKVPGSEPCLLWIVSLYWSDGDIGLSFPNPTGQSYPHVNFAGTDRNEAHLASFDAAGTKVWLQVEPGDASVLDLIDLVLTTYGHHACVAGFGVDVEWFNPTEVSTGRAVTDAEALAWDARVKSYNPGYRLFLKHYLQSRMPPTVRGDLLFVDDSQGFNSLSHMVNEFTSWGNRFSPADVGFQFGYPNDRPWWSTFGDPAGTIAGALDAAVPNATGFFWVDFTIEEIVPLGDAPVMTVQPMDRRVAYGTKVTFSVSASGDGTLTYQWQKDGADLIDGGHYADVRTPVLTVSGADDGDVGSYRCVVANGCGSVVSATAELTVGTPGDLDGDGDVDLDDAGLVQACLTGAFVLVTDPACHGANLDGDSDVDDDDLSIVRSCLSGANVPAYLGCAD